MKESQKKYRQKPESKLKALLYKREYNKRPEVKEKNKQYNKRARERRKGGNKN